MYKLMGGSGCYQVTMVVVSVVSLFLVACPINLLSYAAPDPIAECKGKIMSDSFESCSEQKACSLMVSGRGRIRFQNENWTQKFQMYCDMENKRNLIKNVYPLMNLVIGMFGLLSVDIIGRKYSFHTMFVVTSVGCGLLYFGDTFFMKLLGLAITSCNAMIISSLFTISLSEWISPTAKLQRYTVILMFSAYPLGNIIFNLIVQLNNDSDFLTYMTIGSCFFATLLPCLFAIESPLFLIQAGKINEVKNVVLEIAKFNRLKPNIEDLNHLSEGFAALALKKQQIAEMQKKKTGNSTPLWRLLSKKLFLYQIITLSLIGTYISIVNYSLYMHLQDFGRDSIETNGIILAAVTFISNVLVIPFISRLERRLSSILCQGVMITASLLLLTISRSNKVNSS